MPNDSSQPRTETSTAGRHVRPGLGSELRSTRLARGVEIPQLSAALLLSTRQIAGLEADDSTAFHNQTFYVRAAEAYARWLGVPDPVLEREPDVERQEPVPPRDRPRGSIRLWVALGIGVVLVALVAPYVIRQEQEPAGGAPMATSSGAAQTNVPAEAAPDVPAAPPGTTAAASPPESEPMLLEAAERAWLFVRYADGGTVERWLDAGVPFDLGSEPVYLALGTEHALVRRGGRVRRLDPWAVGSQVRVNKDGLTALFAELQP